MESLVTSVTATSTALPVLQQYAGQGAWLLLFVLGAILGVLITK